MSWDKVVFGVPEPLIVLGYPCYFPHDLHVLFLEHMYEEHHSARHAPESALYLTCKVQQFICRMLRSDAYAQA
jgi:hypothetical protein